MSELPEDPGHDFAYFAVQLADPPEALRNSERERLTEALAKAMTRKQSWRAVAWRSVRTRWHVGTAAAALVLAVTLGFMSQQRPQYRSTAVLLIEPTALHVTAVHEETTGQHADYMRTQRQILESARIARLVLKRLGVRELPGFESELVSERRNVNAFRQSLSVETYRATRILQVAFQSPDPKFAARAANGAVEAYIEDARRQTVNVVDQAARQLRTKERTMAPLVRQARDRAAAYALKHATHDIGAEPAMTEQIRRLESELSQTRDEQTKVVGRLEELRAGPDTPQRARLRAPLEARSSALTGRLGVLERELTTLRTKVADLAEKKAHLKKLMEKAEQLGATYKRLLKRIDELEMCADTGRPEQNIWLIDRARPATWPVTPSVPRWFGGGVAAALLVGLLTCLLLGPAPIGSSAARSGATVSVLVALGVGTIISDLIVRLA